MRALLRIGGLLILITGFVYFSLQAIDWQQGKLEEQAKLPPTITGATTGSLLGNNFVLESVNTLNPNPWNISCTYSEENNDPKVTGLITYETPFYAYNKTDYCENEHYLNEFWCDEFNVAKRNYGLCIFGCHEGSCISEN